MYLSDPTRRIIRVLRQESRNQFQLATDTGLALFAVRAELANLRRERIATATYRDREMVWELTTYGAGVAWSADQMEIGA